MAQQHSTNIKTPSFQLDAEIGTEMQVEFPFANNRIKLILIGLLSGEFLIYHLPENKADLAAQIASSKEKGVNIRCISRGTAFGFHSLVIKVLTKPKCLIFIKYPTVIQKQIIRKNQRVKCLLPARLSQQSVVIPGTIADLSRSGCHFQAKKKPFTIEHIKLLQTGQKISFAFSLPGLEEEKDIPSIIKNTFIDFDKIEIGIEFIDVDKGTLSIMDNFINMSFDISPL